jgi:histidinol dehydrogenase
MSTVTLPIIDWITLDAAARCAVLERPGLAVDGSICAAVAGIIQDVRARGDAALRELTRRLDRCDPEHLDVSAEEASAARATLDPALARALTEAGDRIERFHRATAPQPVSVSMAAGVTCERILRPIGRVGLYVPAGSAPLPSTALMLGVPARIAGCAQVIMCTPADADGRCDPAVLVAAGLCGVTRIFKLGGAQAIAAMAYGTKSVLRCDKIFGPGNAWVTEAKRQVAADAGSAAIDLPAGPSEVLVIADASADAECIAADLLAQAEHGPDSQVLCISDTADLLRNVAQALDRQLRELPRATIAAQSLAAARLILCMDIDEAVSISNAYAPEHLILNVSDPRRWLGCVQNAGSVFLGRWSPEAVGDYCSGTNHVLPTGGAARAHSGLSVASFLKQITVQELTRSGLGEIGPCAVTLASGERLHAHARAVSLRLERAAECA